MTRDRGPYPDDAPRSAAEPRPDGVPYYIDPDCPDCGRTLVLFDAFTLPDRETWHDEWVCPACMDGIHLDWPAEQWEKLIDRTRDDQFVPIDTADHDDTVDVEYETDPEADTDPEP